MSSTTRGNEFRDEVARLLKAAGFTNLEVESKIKFKRVDISTIWKRSSLDGPLRYAVETKSYTKSVPLSECSAFASQYGELVSKGVVDRAWLISNGPISAEGRNLIRGKLARNLDCMTFSDLQAKLLPLDGYISDLESTYDAEGIAHYYIPTRTSDNLDLCRSILDWLSDSGTEPLAILGSYGEGKSTFALQLAMTLLKHEQTNSTPRIPIIIPLGEILDEQSIDGLIGKLLASRHRVENYHFHLFSKLNEQGRFLLIFDGFDEMKHGMTFRVFESNIDEILKMNRGAAKIIILGRPNVFQNDREFKTLMNGRDFTITGQDLAASDRRPFKTFQLDGFSKIEATEFVKRYFTYKATEREPLAADRNWIASRIEDICTLENEDLLTRPVHGKMLCDLALDRDFKIASLSQYGLYDAFIHRLFLREAKKKERFGHFNSSHIRAFNRAVAWWLWNQGGLATSSVTDIPFALCLEVTQGIRHDLDQDGLKRELMVGCLVEKNGGSIYFPHRSIQEFLVAEFIWEDLCLEGGIRRDVTADELLQAATTEVIIFLSGRFRLAATSGKPHHDRLQSILSTLNQLDGSHRSSETIALHYAACIAVRKIDLPFFLTYKWGVLLGFFCSNENVDFKLKNKEAISFLDSLADLLQPKLDDTTAKVSEQTALDILYLWLQVCLYNPDAFPERRVADLIIKLLPINKILSLTATRQHSMQLAKQDGIGLWLYLNFMRRKKEKNDDCIVIFWEQLISYFRSQNVHRFDDLEFPVPDDSASGPKIKCSLKIITSRMLELSEMSSFEVAGMKQFFEENDINYIITTV